jgi:hypothetical protein
MRQIVLEVAASAADQRKSQQESQCEKVEGIIRAVDKLAGQKDRLSKSADASQERHHWQNLLPMWITAVASLLGVAAACIFAYLQWTTMERQIELESRPWVAIDLARPDEKQIDVLEPQGKGSSERFDLGHWIKNFGHAPASVVISGTVFECPKEPAKELAKTTDCANYQFVREKSEEVCAWAEKNLRDESLYVVIPNVTVTYRVTDLKIDISHPPDQDGYHLTYIGCIAYESVGGNKPYRSPFEAAIKLPLANGQGTVSGVWMVEQAK